MAGFWEKASEESRKRRATEEAAQQEQMAGLPEGARNMYAAVERDLGKAEADSLMTILRSGSKKGLEGWEDKNKGVLAKKRHEAGMDPMEAMGSLDRLFTDAGVGDFGKVKDSAANWKGQFAETEATTKEEEAKSKTDEMMGWAKEQADKRFAMEERRDKLAQEQWKQQQAARAQSIEAATEFRDAELMAPKLMQQGTDAAARNALTIAKGGGRSGPSFATALAGNTQQGAIAAQTGANMGAQEKLQRQQAYMQALGGARQQDLAAHGQMAGSAAQAGAAGMGQMATPTNMAMGREQGATAFGQGLQQNAINYSQDVEKMNAQMAHQMQMGVMQGVMGIAGGAAGGLASDIRAKEDIEAGGTDIDQFLRQLKPASYEYKEGAQEALGAPAGRQMGIMAQDAERTPVGADMVREGPGGVKMLDRDRMASTSLAANARLNDRLDSLETALMKAGEGGKEIVRKAVEEQDTGGVSFGKGRIEEKPEVSFGPARIEPTPEVSFGRGQVEPQPALSFGKALVEPSPEPVFGRGRVEAPPEISFGRGRAEIDPRERILAEAASGADQLRGDTREFLKELFKKKKKGKED